MTGITVNISRQAPGTESSNIINYGRPLFVIKDIPGPAGVPLNNIIWELKDQDTIVAKGVTDQDGRVMILNKLEPGKEYQLEYAGCQKLITIQDLDPTTSTKGLQQRLIMLGYAPGAIDDNFGELTKSTLKLFQLENDLLNDGVYGDKSQEKLSDIIES